MATATPKSEMLATLVMMATALLFAVELPCAHAQASPALAPSNDGTSIDQGIALCADARRSRADILDPLHGRLFFLLAAAFMIRSMRYREEGKQHLLLV
ncbi:hypothetical protein AKJ16_DCAP10414 [Drosera capensis]